MRWAGSIDGRCEVNTGPVRLPGGPGTTTNRSLKNYTGAPNDCNSSRVFSTVGTGFDSIFLCLFRGSVIYIHGCRVGEMLYAVISNYVFGHKKSFFEV